MRRQNPPETLPWPALQASHGISTEYNVISTEYNGISTENNEKSTEYNEGSTEYNGISTEYNGISTERFFVFCVEAACGGTIFEGELNPSRV